MSHEITTENIGGVPVKVFHMGLDRANFPDEETFLKAQASVEEAKRHSTPEAGEDWIIPNDKVIEVFRALVDNAKPLGMGFLDPNSTTPFTLEMARKLWTEALTFSEAYQGQLEVGFDYVCGRPIKMTFTQRTDTGEWLINTRLYDRDQSNSAQVITAALEV